MDTDSKSYNVYKRCGFCKSSVGNFKFLNVCYSYFSSRLASGADLSADIERGVRTQFYIELPYALQIFSGMKSGAWQLFNCFFSIAVVVQW